MTQYIGTKHVLSYEFVLIDPETIKYAIESTYHKDGVINMNITFINDKKCTFLRLVYLSEVTGHKYLATTSN